MRNLTPTNIPDQDLKYMRYFIDERLHKLDENRKAAEPKLIPAPWENGSQPPPPSSSGDLQ